MPPRLVRSMGRWTLAALMINSVIGSGIFGLPAAVDGLTGTAAPVAYVLAAAGVALIMASFAEVGSQFRESGGIYLYARRAFGRFAGIQMGWMALMVRVSAHAAIANLLVVYLAEFVPGVLATVPRAAVIVFVLVGLACINVRGIRQGALVSTLFAIGKVTPLVAFAVVGLVMAGDQIPGPVFDAGPTAWGQAVLMLMFAFGGFESALLPMGEARNPRHDVPVALATGLVACVVIYVAVHLVVMATLPNPSASQRPLSDAAGALLGPVGASMMAVAAVVSILGIIGAGMVNTPRLFFALAQGGDFPPALCRVHARYRTPHVALLAYAAAVCVLALSGTFIWNAVLSAAGRMLTYALVCAALLRLRYTEPDADAFRVPAGRLVALCGLAFCAVLVMQMGRGEFMVIVATAAVALANWVWVTRRDAAPPRAGGHSRAAAASTFPSGTG